MVIRAMAVPAGTGQTDLSGRQPTSHQTASERDSGQSHGRGRNPAPSRRQRRYTGSVPADVEPVVDSPPNPNAALAAAARTVAARRLGRVRVPCAVTVHLDEQLEFERVIVEIVGINTDADLGGFSDCLRDVIVLLAREAKRLTTSKILEGLDKQGTAYGEGRVKAVLAQAVKDELLTSRPDAKPPGYGLPSWA